MQTTREMYLGDKLPAKFTPFMPCGKLLFTPGCAGSGSGCWKFTFFAVLRRIMLHSAHLQPRLKLSQLL